MSVSVPLGWASVTLADIACWSSGGTPSRANPNFYEGSIPWIKTGELGPQFLHDSEEHISDDAIAASSAKVFSKGSVAIAMYGATIGKASILAVDASTNQACAVGMPDAVGSLFLYYFLLAQRDAFVDAGKGGAQPNISQGIVKEWPILVPPPNEQTRIVEKLEELLSDLDAGVAELKAAQRKLAQYRQSLLKAAAEGALTADWRAARAQTGEPQESGVQLLQRILTERRARWEASQLARFVEQGKTTPKGWKDTYPEPVAPDTDDLPALPEGWVWACLDQLADSVKNGLSQKPNTDRMGYPILRINAVRTMSVRLDEVRHLDLQDDEAAPYVLDEGDLLATRYNGSVDLLGVVGVVRGLTRPTLHPDKLIRIKPVLRAPLADWIEMCASTGTSRTHVVSRVKTTAGQTGISGTDMKKMPIPLAPLFEQASCAESVTAAILGIEDQDRTIEHALRQAAAQRKNILKAAFAGQLVPQDPNDEPGSVLLERIRAERVSIAAKRLGKTGRKPSEIA